MNVQSHEVAQVNGLKVSWRLLEWCRQVGFSRSKFYGLKLQQRPKIVRFGKMQMVTESPAEYIQRMTAEQSALDGGDQ